MVNKVLMVAYHYPPVQVSSGVQRALAFSRYIRDHGWEPVVLSANPRAYERTSSDQLKDIPDDIEVVRAFALDTARHLSFKGRYSDLMAMPDRWVSWWLGGVFSGLRLIRKHKPRVIWSTYPIATAHLIAYTLHKITGVPLVADFRDSMTEEGYPREPRRRSFFQWIERKVVHSCSKAVFTTPGAVRMYKERYPGLPEDRWLMIPNGYNEEIFTEVERELAESGEAIQEQSPITLLHSGVVYPSERDPSHLFRALSELKSDKLIDASRLKIVFRAGGHDQIYRPMLQDMGIEDLVELKTSIPYREALKEILSAQGLLILQSSGCNHQVPAKVYEYFRAGKPVLSLTDADGDTAATLIEAGLKNIVPLDDSAAIKEGLLSFLDGIESDAACRANDDSVKRYSRYQGAVELSKILDSIV